MPASGRSPHCTWSRWRLSIAALLTEYVDGLPEADTLRVVERAEGVPLYAVETVRMLADRGVLQPAGPDTGWWRAPRSAPDVPETLHALVAARLDGVPDANSLAPDVVRGVELPPWPRSAP